MYLFSPLREQSLEDPIEARDVSEQYSSDETLASIAAWNPLRAYSWVLYPPDPPSLELSAEGQSGATGSELQLLSLFDISHAYMDQAHVGFNRNTTGQHVGFTKSSSYLVGDDDESVQPHDFNDPVWETPNLFLWPTSLDQSSLGGSHLLSNDLGSPTTIFDPVIPVPLIPELELPSQTIDEIPSLSIKLEGLDQNLHHTGPCSRVWRIRGLGPRRQPTKDVSANTRKDLASSISKQSRRGPQRSIRRRIQDAAGELVLPACYWCRERKKKCELNIWDPRGPCSNCSRLLRGSLLSELPCQRHEIKDASLFRDQTTPWPGFGGGFNSMEIRYTREWDMGDVMTVDISHGVGNAKFRLHVGRFVPWEEDVLKKTWVDESTLKCHYVPPYAILDLVSAAEELRKYVSCGIAHFIRSPLNKSDRFMGQTLRAALWWCKKAPTEDEKRVLSNALRLWVTAQITSNPEQIVGEQYFGSTVMDSSSPYHGTIPISPHMCAQLELISYSALLHPYRREILGGIISMLKTNSRSCWFTMYLTCFVLAHSCSNVTSRDEAFAGQLGRRMRWANPESIVGHHVGVQTLLTYFHHYCKPILLRAATNGVQAEIQFTRASDSLHTISNLIRGSARWIREKQTHVQAIRSTSKFGDDYYFVAQLFESEGKPAPIARIDETRH